MKARAGDRTGAVIGTVTLAVVALAYPLVETAMWQPLAAFAVPPLLTAIAARWRVTLTIGLASVAAAVAYGVATGLDTPAVGARLTIITVVVACAVTVAAARDRHERAAVEAQRATDVLSAFEAGLIGRPPAVPGFRVATRYEPAEPRLRLSGDFVDALATPGGGLAFVVGDVSGHGASQAALGASLRSGWRAAVTALPGDPVGWVEAMRAAFFPTDLGAGQEPFRSAGPPGDGEEPTEPADGAGGPGPGHLDKDREHYATLCTGQIGPDGSSVLVSAGHPWPVLLGPSPHAVALKIGLPLGISSEAVWEATDLNLDGPLVVYTDGLVEAPDEHGGRWNEDGLVAWLAGAPPHDPERLADELLAAASAGRRLTDDIAILVVAPESSPPTPR